MNTKDYIKILIGGAFLILTFSWVKKLLPNADPEESKNKLEIDTEEVTVQSINDWFNKQPETLKMRYRNNLHSLEDILNQFIIFDNGVTEAFKIVCGVQSCQEYAYYNALFEDRRPFENDTLDGRLREVGQGPRYNTLEMILDKLC